MDELKDHPIFKGQDGKGAKYSDLGIELPKDRDGKTVGNQDDIIDENENYFKAAGDLALMFPLLEMSREKAPFVKNILYIWNDLKELNEHKDKRELKLKCEQNIPSLKKYYRLEKLT